MELKQIEEMVKNNEWSKLIEKGEDVRLQDWFANKNTNLTSKVKEVISESDKAVKVIIGKQHGYEFEDGEQWLPKSVLMVFVNIKDGGAYEVTAKGTKEFDKNGKLVK